MWVPYRKSTIRGIVVNADRALYEDKAKRKGVEVKVNGVFLIALPQNERLEYIVFNMKIVIPTCFDLSAPHEYCAKQALAR